MGNVAAVVQVEFYVVNPDVLPVKGQNRAKFSDVPGLRSDNDLSFTTKDVRLVFRPLEDSAETYVVEIILARGENEVRTRIGAGRTAKDCLGVCRRHVDRLQRRWIGLLPVGRTCWQVERDLERLEVGLV